MLISVCVCERERDRQTNRQTDRQAGRQTDRSEWSHTKGKKGWESIGTRLKAENKRKCQTQSRFNC